MIFGTAATTATQKFRRTDSKSFCRFCAAAVPRDRQTDGREVHEVRTYTISTSFRLCAVCDAVKTADSRQKKSPLTQGGRQRVSHDDSCLRCCYAGPIFRTDIVKTTPMTGQDVQLYNRALAIIQLPPGQGCAPTPQENLVLVARVIRYRRGSSESRARSGIF